jgi:hypothetical protein
VVGVAGEGLRRPQLTKNCGGPSEESANLPTVQGSLVRFLEPGGPERRGGSPELSGRVRGGREKRRHGEELTGSVVVYRERKGKAEGGDARRETSV